MVALTAIANDPIAAAAALRADQPNPRVTEATRNTVLPVSLELMGLSRIGDTKANLVRSVDQQGKPIEFIVFLEKLKAGVVGVDIVQVGLGTSRTVSFGVHLDRNGKISGYDTHGSGRVNAVETPNLAFIGINPQVQFSFDDSALGPLDFSTFTFTAGSLELLQGIDGGSGVQENNIIQGTDGDDSLTGTAGNDTINGLNGSDTIDGQAGDDALFGGGGGNNVLIGGDGKDTLIGGTLTDEASYASDAAGVSVNLTTGGTVDGMGAKDTLTLIENVTGSGFNDTLTGDGNANTIEGGAGDDTLDGGTGDDTLIGGTGTDTISDFTTGAATDDVIDVSGVTSLTNFTEVLTATTDDGGGNIVIDLGGGSTLTLTGVIKTELASDDFVF